MHAVCRLVAEFGVLVDVAAPSDERASTALARASICVYSDDATSVALAPCTTAAAAQGAKATTKAGVSGQHSDGIRQSFFSHCSFKSGVRNRLESRLIDVVFDRHR